MDLHDLMTRNPLTCRSDDLLHDAVRTMWDADVGALPVLDRDGKLVGMLTDRDACMAAYTQGRPLSMIPVHVAASRGVVAAKATDDVETVETLMRRHRVRRIPVVDERGRCVGIVSLNDLARRAHPTKRRSDGLAGDSVVRTLATISEPAASRRVPA